ATKAPKGGPQPRRAREQARARTQAQHARSRPRSEARPRAFDQPFARSSKGRRPLNGRTDRTPKGPQGPFFLRLDALMPGCLDAFLPFQPLPVTPASYALPMPHVKLTTSMGDIVLQLDEEKAPGSTANFLAYVDRGHYDQTVFHRVISNFMIQAGGFTTDLKQTATMDPIANEWNNGLTNSRGTVAMARTSDPNSATAQFFINVKDNDFLSQPRDGAGYAVFGRVISGMDVVDKIRNVPTGSQRG